MNEPKKADENDICRPKDEVGYTIFRNNSKQFGNMIQSDWEHDSSSWDHGERRVCWQRVNTRAVGCDPSTWSFVWWRVKTPVIDTAEKLLCDLDNDMHLDIRQNYRNRISALVSTARAY